MKKSAKIRPAKQKKTSKTKVSSARFSVAHKEGLSHVLHLGAGNVKPGERLHARFHGSEWKEIRADLQGSIKPDIKADLPSLTPIADNQFHAVWAPYSLQNIPPHEVLNALTECQRVLLPGGYIFGTVQDMETVAEGVLFHGMENAIYRPKDAPAVTSLDLIFGPRAQRAQNDPHAEFRMGFSAHTLARYLKETGWHHISVTREGQHLWFSANRPSPKTDTNRKIKINSDNLNERMTRRDAIDRAPHSLTGLEKLRKLLKKK